MLKNTKSRSRPDIERLLFFWGTDVGLLRVIRQANRDHLCRCRILKSYPTTWPDENSIQQKKLPHHYMRQLFSLIH